MIPHQVSRTGARNVLGRRHEQSRRSLPPRPDRASADGVLTVTLNRPETRNALSESLMRALQLTLDEAVEDKDVKRHRPRRQGLGVQRRP